MGTGSDDPGPEEERKRRAREKARLRKQRYDEKMRNGGDGFRRQACVVFLNDQAREVLRRNREERKLLEQPPVLDSQLIEGLLLAHGARGEPDGPLGNASVEAEVQRPPTARLLKEHDRQGKLIKAMELRHLADEATIQNLQRELEEADNGFSPLEWEKAEYELLEAHDWQMALFGQAIVQELRSALTRSPDDSAALRAVSAELAEHLRRLIDSLLRQHEDG